MVSTRLENSPRVAMAFSTCPLVGAVVVGNSEGSFGRKSYGSWPFYPPPCPSEESRGHVPAGSPVIQHPNAHRGESRSTKASGHTATTFAPWSAGGAAFPPFQKNRRHARPSEPQALDGFRRPLPRGHFPRSGGILGDG